MSMETKKVMVTSRHWTKIHEGPVMKMEADHRVSFDIDPRGHAWARIARGNDEEVEVELTLGPKV